MISPVRWTQEELTADAVAARYVFRKERLDEPLERWRQIFDQHDKQFRQLLEEYGFSNPANFTAKRVAEVFEAHLDGALRYFAAPPISEDDLQVLVEATGRVSTALITKSPDVAGRVAEVIIRTFDPKRFPWVAENRAPHKNEKDAAILASAALLTAQRISTNRRNESKAAQEKAVKKFMTSIGFKEVPARQINNMGDAPTAGEFCGEAKVGSRKADVSIRLYDGRLVPIECKVSNSSVNSVKRINNDAAVKAVRWLDEFGTKNVVPTAVISGVFNVPNLIQAQEHGLTLYWSHRLDDLGVFVNAT